VGIANIYDSKYGLVQRLVKTQIWFVCGYMLHGCAVSVIACVGLIFLRQEIGAAS